MTKLIPILFLITLFIGCDSKAQLDYSIDPTWDLVDNINCDTLYQRYSSADMMNKEDAYHLALIEGKCGDTEKAIDYMKRAIILDDKNPFKHYSMARLLVDNLDMENALNEVLIAESLFSENYHIQVLKAEIFYYNGYKKDCLRTLNQIERHDKTKSDSYRIRALIYRQEQNIDKGYDNIKKAINNEPDDPWLYFLAGDILIIGKRYKESIPYLDKCVEMDNSNSDFFLRRGVAHYYAGEKQKGEKDWYKSLDMGNEKAQEYIDTYIN